MKIGLIDVDGHNFPNLALMKISAYHKQLGDDVEWWFGDMFYYDRVYKSKVFDSTYSPDTFDPWNCGQLIKGGTGYGLDNKLPDEVEHTYPDYSLYPELTKNTAYGFLSRGCPRGCPFCIVADKEGRCSYKVADLKEFRRNQRYIKLLDPNLLACSEWFDLLSQLAESGAWVDFTQGLDARLLTPEKVYALNNIKVKMIHFAWDLMEQSDAVLRGLQIYSELGAIKDRRKLRVYVLINFNTTEEQDLYRIYRLRELGYDPYVMVYDKPHASRRVKQMQRWVNNKYIWNSCYTFEEYLDK